MTFRYLLIPRGVAGGRVKARPLTPNFGQQLLNRWVQFVTNRVTPMTYIKVHLSRPPKNIYSGYAPAKTGVPVYVWWGRYEEWWHGLCSLRMADSRKLEHSRWRHRSSVRCDKKSIVVLASLCPERLHWPGKIHVAIMLLMASSTNELFCKKNNKSAKAR